MTFVPISYRGNEILYAWEGRGLWRWTSWAHPEYHMFYQIKDNELWEWL